MTASNHFNSLGRALLQNGYQIIPIKQGEKRPAIGAWQTSNIGVDDLYSYPNCGVGILCGRTSPDGKPPIVAIDIDISHPDIGQGVVNWCRANLGYTAERIGAAPRVLLVYRSSGSGWTKGHSMRFFDPNDPEKPSGKPNEQQVEILSLGQQFVAYHVHPDTGEEYKWTDAFGGIAYMSADMLPLITEAHVDALLAEVDRLVRSAMIFDPELRILNQGSTPTLALSGPAGSNVLAALSPRCDVPISEASDLLKFIENGQMGGAGQDYDFWLHVGMALHHEYAGTPSEPQALDAWKAWGASSPKNNPREYDYKWESFGKARGGSPTTLRWLLKIGNEAKHDAELAARKTVLDEMKAMVAECEDRFELTGDVAKKLRALMPDDQVVMAEMITAMRARFKVLSEGTLLPLKAVRELLQPERKQKAPTVLEAQPLTEFGNARRMVERYKGEMLYVPEIDNWYTWAGHQWRKATDVEIQYRAKQTVLHLVEEAKSIEPAQLPEFFDFCKESQRVKMVNAMITLAKSEPEIMVPISVMDANPNLLGVRNGVVDLATGVFREGRKDDYITLSMGCEYIPNAQCPLFDQTLIDVFKGDSEMAEFFMRCIGYALLGRPKEAMLFIAFGSGSNGKSTLLGLAQRVFGSYAKSADAGTFISDGGSRSAGGAREDLLRLKGARFVYVNEPDEGGELREGIVKSMTGGDTITARGLFATSSTEFTPTWATFMPTNHKPIIKGTDHGIWRRLTLIPFERNFDDDPLIKKDKERQEKLLAEMPGVLNRFLQAAMRYKQQGLSITGRVKAARDEYREQMNVLSEWIDECCDVGPDLSDQMARLWESWSAFANRNGMQNHIRSSISLGRKLDQKFPAGRTVTGQRCRVGIRVKDAWAISSKVEQPFSDQSLEESKKIAEVNLFLP